jgi:hypothetical protein
VEKVIDIFQLWLVKEPKVFVLMASFFFGNDMFLDDGTQFNVIVVPILNNGTDTSFFFLMHVCPPAICPFKLLLPSCCSSNYFKMSSVFIMQFNIGEFYETNVRLFQFLLKLRQK